MKKWGGVFSGTGTVFISLLSCAACPVCFPIYAGLLSLIGIELAEVHEFFFPIMIVFAVITISFMAYQIYHHHGKWHPLALATAAAIGMASAAFMGYEYLLYGCLALFMGSVFWNKRTLVHKGHGCC
jgi:mercuric ion transport protein